MGAPEADSRELPANRLRGDVPLQFGKYRLSRLLARGGMGEVYLARLVGELGFEKRLVIKTILPELAAKKRFIELFAAEAKTAVALSHGNIVPTYELGRSNDIFYIVMGYVDGPSVAQLLSACRESEREPNLAAAMHIARGVLAGLAYAHHAEPSRPAVVHRDITPRNVLLDRSGQVRIVDFGIAAPAKTEGVRAGSTGFVAPEQARGDSPDPRADVFSAACLLYELCTHKRAFPKEDVWVSPDLELLPEPLREPLSAALSFEADARPRDATALLSALRPVIFEYAGSFDDQSLAGFLREVFADGWSKSPSERSGVNPIRGFEGKNETFATRLTAVTGLSSRETPALPAAANEGVKEPARSGARLEPAAPAQEERRRPPVAAILFGGLGLGALALAFWGVGGDDPPPRADAASRIPAPEPPPPVAAVGAAPGSSDATPTPTPTEPVRPATPVIHRLESVPPDAELRVDGTRVRGNSPFDIELPAEGTVTLELRKPGFETRKLSAEAGASLPGRVTLTKIKPKEPGFLRVTAPGVPWAEVRLNGKKVGTTPTRKLTVPSGRHRLEVKCIPDACPEPRTIATKNVTIEPNQLRVVKAGR